jgi:hypothetical protein
MPINLAIVSCMRSHPGASSAMLKQRRRDCCGGSGTNPDGQECHQDNPNRPAATVMSRQKAWVLKPHEWFLAVAAEAWLESIDSCQKPRRVKMYDFSSQRLSQGHAFSLRHLCC